MNEMPPDLAAWLATSGLVRDPTRAVVHPIIGGVSSDVWRIDEGGHCFVVKRSVSKLRVRADWFSNPARLRYEFLYLRTVAEIFPGAVPQLLSTQADAPFIAMEFLGPEYKNWKALLLEGVIHPDDARRAGEILGRVHAVTRNSPEIRARFETMEYFTELRIDAYLRTTASRQESAVAEAICCEADRLALHRECLVHGDYSPKNMLTGLDRFVVLDCETACFGDPAFDVAFLLNHLLLKALFRTSKPGEAAALEELQKSIAQFREAYQVSFGPGSDAVEARVARLLPMLLLARVDGKSPVEYLLPPQQNHVRQFAPRYIRTPPGALDLLIADWFSSLSRSPK